MFLKKSSSKESKSDLKNIVTINAYTDKKYIYKSESFKTLDKLSYNTSNYISSYVNNKDMINTVVHLSRNIPEEDIQDILDIKAYEELGLDQANNYIISSIEAENAGEEREFHIFVAEPEILDELFEPIKLQTKYIDLIVPAPLLYKTLYKKEILHPGGVDCFVYFTMQDAFVTFYRDGEFLYSKSIEFSLENIYEKYCEIVGEKVDEKEFFTVLESEGMKASDDRYQQNFMKIFGEVFIVINDIIIYAKRAFSLDTIDKMYLGTVNGPIVGLDEYSQNYLGLHSADLNFNYGINSGEWYVDQLQNLLLLSSLDYIEDESSIVNLTMYPRAPSFANRAGGQFLIATFAAVSVGLGYPLYYLVDSYINDAKSFALRKEDTRLTDQSIKYKGILKKKKDEINLLNKDINKLTATYSGKTKTLTSIHDKKVNYRLKSGVFYTIAEELTKLEVNVDMLFSKNDTVWMSLVSSDDRKFTELIKYISDTHFDEISQIDIEKIQKDPKNNYYKGLLKVELK